MSRNSSNLDPGPEHVSKRSLFYSLALNALTGD